MWLVTSRPPISRSILQSPFDWEVSPPVVTLVPSNAQPPSFLYLSHHLFGRKMKKLAFQPNALTNVKRERERAAATSMTTTWGPQVEWTREAAVLCVARVLQESRMLCASAPLVSPVTVCPAAYVPGSFVPSQSGRLRLCVHVFLSANTNLHSNLPSLAPSFKRESAVVYADRLTGMRAVFATQSPRFPCLPPPPPLVFYHSLLHRKAVADVRTDDSDD